MNVSRHAFLKLCGSALLGLPARGLLAWDGPDSGNVPGAAGLDEAMTFRAHVDSSFGVRTADDRRVTLRLAEVAERPVHKNVEQFSLIFHGPVGEPIADGTYAFEHRLLDRFDLFIVRVGAPDGRRAVYQACFSRHALRSI